MSCSPSETRKIIKILAAMGLANPPKVDEEQLVAAYHMVWSDLSADMVADAVTMYVRGGATFWPSPGALRSLALKSGAGMPDAEMAWAEVQAAIARHGLSGRPVWSSAVLQKAVEAVGWRSICMTEDAGMGTLRAQFRNTYQSLLTSVVAREDARAVLQDAQERREALQTHNGAFPALPGRDGHVAAQNGGVADDPRQDAAPHETAARRRARTRWERQHPTRPFPDRPMAMGPTGDRFRDAATMLACVPAFKVLPPERRRSILDRLRHHLETEGEPTVDNGDNTG